MTFVYFVSYWTVGDSLLFNIGNTEVKTDTEITTIEQVRRLERLVSQNSIVRIISYRLLRKENGRSA